MMGTLYECLREARLEQFYPAFRANGITRSETLINLGMPEFFALGITSSEDKRRLVELVSIIKAVHSSSLSDSPGSQRRSTGLRQIHSANAGSTNTVRDNSPNSGRVAYHLRNQPRPSSKGGAVCETSGSAVQHLEPARDVIVQDRVPNYSVVSYMGLLRQISESSESDAVDEQSDDEQTSAQMVHKNVSSPIPARVSSRGSAVERIKHSKVSSYNYGVHKVNTPVKTRTSRSGSHRSSAEEKIKVCVRKRPLTRREQRSKEEDIVLVESTNTLIVNEPKLAVDLKAYTLQHEFIFDEVFDESCSNEDVYIRATRPLISCIFSGGTATCFAYGQTGAGKTHTMLGGENVPGLYLLAGQDIFSIIQSGTYGRGLHVWVSFFEIYCGQLFDLLNRRNRLHAREDGSRQVCIAGLTETEATSVASLVQILEYGNSVRSKGSTGVNPDSSRSHAVLQLDIRNSEDVKVGKMSFIDLAGSERASDVTDTDKQTRIEGAEINQSLLALKECIRSIDQDSRHTPFRQSKLTHILKDSFVGNSRTCMIANISPTHTACEHTLNTLRYADRVKELRRDSLRSSSVGNAMNLLMNIPPAAPSNFHPSNILSSSTPMRASSNSRRERPNIPADIDLDPTEIPVRGHNLQRKQRETIRHRQGQAYSHTSATQSRIEQLSVVSSDPKVPLGMSSDPKVPLGMSSRSSAHATAASQGTCAPPPDASPSESEQTDTDSCNVTHSVNTNTRNLARHAPVMKSTDTEFDFPTSDFNNIDDINDLNRSDTHMRGQNVPQERDSLHPSQRSPDDQAVSAAAAAADMVVGPTFSSGRQVPVLRPVVYRSADQGAEVGHPGPVSYASHISGITQKFQTSDVASPQVSKHPPSFKKAHSREVDTSDESVNDDQLYEGPSVPQEMNNLAALRSVSAVHPVSFMNKHLVIPVHTDDDLIDLPPKECGRPVEQSGTYGINDLSVKDGNSSSSPHVGDISTVLEDSPNKVQFVYPRVMSPSSRSKSPSAKELKTHAEKPPHLDSNSFFSSVSQLPPSTRRLPQPRGKSPPSDHLQTASLTQRTGSPQCFSRSNEDLAHGSSAQCLSDGSDSGSHRKASPSPPGETSGDSLENIRAPLSDQGQGGYRTHIKSNMRKERSDPMIALDMQRKKHTLPDPHSISKMLTRSNTPKSGKVSRDASWKVIHNELPLPPSTEVIPVSGDCHTEPGSLASADFDGQEENIEQQEHFSDGNSNSATAVRDQKQAVVAVRSARGKQLPHVPGPMSEADIQALSGQVQHQDISQHKLEPSISGLRLPVKINSAVVTEKLSSGAMFSPIHPQPVTVAGARSVAELASPSSIFQPTPVTAASASNLDLAVASQSGSQEAITPDIWEAKMHLVAAHEDQLATITSLCKNEMRLLLSAKKVMGKKGFDDYLRRVSDILQQKMAAIATLLEQISTYRNSHSQSNSVASSAVVSLSESGSSLVCPSHLTPK